MATAGNATTVNGVATAQSPNGKSRERRCRCLHDICDCLMSNCCVKCDECCVRCNFWGHGWCKLASDDDINDKELAERLEKYWDACLQVSALAAGFSYIVTSADISYSPEKGPLGEHREELFHLFSMLAFILSMAATMISAILKGVVASIDVRTVKGFTKGYWGLINVPMASCFAGIGMMGNCAMVSVGGIVYDWMYWFLVGVYLVVSFWILFILYWANEASNMYKNYNNWWGTDDSYDFKKWRAEQKIGSKFDEDDDYKEYVKDLEEKIRQRKTAEEEEEKEQKKQQMRTQADEEEYRDQFKEVLLVVKGIAAAVQDPQRVALVKGIEERIQYIASTANNSVKVMDRQRKTNEDAKKEDMRENGKATEEMPEKSAKAGR